MTGSTATPGSPEAGPCPCGAGASYVACCGRWHDGPLRLQAPDALALMRSRYTAFALRLEAYLLDTWHPSTRPRAPLGLEPDLGWLGLEVRRHDRQDPGHETVEFVARGAIGGRPVCLHETSRFVREDGRWTYLDGEVR